VSLLVFALAFMTLQVGKYTQKSAVWDEPIHLTAGYAALTQRDFRVDPSHPPFLRMWAAIPLTLLPVRPLDLAEADRIPVRSWFSRAYNVAHRFLYVANDADTLLYRARFMMALWGVVLGLLIFAWAFEWLGYRAALVALALYVLEPNLAAHASLVTTDFGLTCFVFAAVYCLWRLSRRFSLAGVGALAACVGLAVVAKFSAVVLIAMLTVLLVAAARSPALTPRRTLTTITAVFAVAIVAVWAAYGFQYRPSASPAWLLAPHTIDNTDRVPLLTAVVGWIDRYHLLPNAFSEGFLYSQASVRQLPTFLAGQLKMGGWWFYFPVAFVLKTPLALLALTAAGVVVLWMRRSSFGWRNIAFVAVPPAIWMAAAMASHINVGVRHILPVYPFVIMAAAAGVTELVARGGGRRAIAPPAGHLVAVEFGHNYPHPLSFFNLLAGGPANGYRYLADSNLGWGSNLKLLKRWMDRNGVETINLAYFGTADPEYYGIRANYLPGSPTYLQNRWSRPKLPGYVAVSPTVLDGVFLPAWWRHFYAGLLDRTPIAVVGNSLRIYRLERWPEPPHPLADDRALRTLAEGLLLGLRWPEHAIVHYREYLRRRPDDAQAWDAMAVALAQTGNNAEARAGFERALALDPGNVRTRENLRIVQQRLSMAFNRY
jgi:hypothetical protein